MIKDFFSAFRWQVLQPIHKLSFLTASGWGMLCAEIVKVGILFLFICMGAVLIGIVASEIMVQFYL